jgi:hypothetical protein
MWRHLPEALIDEHGFLTLTHGAYPTAEAETVPETRLFVTAWYCGLAEYIKTSTESPNVRRVLITGRPGSNTLSHTASFTALTHYIVSAKLYCTH